jgi:pimeloyl-ACP methyl ester carboxylesterase
VAIPGARVVLLNAAHMSSVERPDDFNRALLDFLQLRPHRRHDIAAGERSSPRVEQLMPVLALVATARVSTPAAQAEALSVAIPGARVVLLNAAHMSSVERPGRAVVTSSRAIDAGARARGDRPRSSLQKIEQCPIRCGRSRADAAVLPLPVIGS